MRPAPRSLIDDVSSLALVAVTHRQAPLALLESVNLDPQMVETITGELLRQVGTSEAVIVSTCNRTELYLAGSQPDTDLALRVLAAQRMVPLEDLDRCAVVSRGDEAALHLMRVAAGLESQVVGEAEVLGQVRSAIASAQATGAAASALTSLFRFAVAAGSLAQSTTDRALIPSLPRLALDAARPDPHAPAGPTVVLGSGAMAALTTDELAERQLEYWVCARRADRALRLAGVPQRVVSFDDLPAALELAEVVVCATGARQPLVDVADLERVMQRRPTRPLTIIDLSLPRNVEPAAGHLPDVTLIDLDGLVANTSDGQRRHREDIVNDELRRYRSWLAGQAARQLITQLHRRVHATCRSTMAATMDGSDLSADAMAAAARATANKILHAPTIAIKNLIAAGDEATALTVLASYGITTPTVETFDTFDSFDTLAPIRITMQETS